MDESKIIAEGKIDLGRVYLEIEGETPAPVLEEKSVTITTNTDTLIEPSVGYDGISKVTVTTNVQPNLYSESYTFLQNDTIVFEPPSGYDGLSSVSITVDVPTEDYSKYGYSNGIPLISEQIPIMDSIQTNWNPTRTSGYRAFYGTNIYIIFPLIDTSNLTTAREMFADNSRLVQIPEFDFSNLTGSDPHQNMFQYCYYLDKDSINTIMLMCSKMTKVTANKTLSYMGINTNSPYLGDVTQYSNYQAFINAGWTLQ